MGRERRRAFDAPALAAIEDLVEATWAIIEAQHPFRDRAKDSDARARLRRKIFILAERSDLSDLDAIQRLALEAFSRGVEN
jgi:hypothetical protein